MKKYFLTTILFLFFITIIYSLPTDEQIQQAANTLGVPYNDLKNFVQSYQSTSIPLGTIQINARELVEAYKDNQLKADNQYKGKIIQIKGKVNNVTKDYKDNYYIELVGTSLISTVNVYVRSSELSKIANLYSGQEITIIGKCEGYNIYYVEVKDAYIVQ